MSVVPCSSISDKQAIAVEPSKITTYNKRITLKDSPTSGVVNGFRDRDAAEAALKVWLKKDLEDAEANLRDALKEVDKATDRLARIESEGIRFNEDHVEAAESYSGPGPSAATVEPREFEFGDDEESLEEETP